MQAVLLDTLSLRPQDIDLSPLTSLGIDLTCYDTTSPAEVAQRIAKADIVLTNKVELSATTLAQAPNVKYIGVMATGTNNIDSAYCDKHNITVANVPAYGTNAVVQHTTMLLLNLATAFMPTIKQVKQGDWSASDYFCLLDQAVVELADKHLVIVGYGELGQRFSQVAAALGMRVSVAARPGVEQAGRQPLDSLLPEADVVSLHCLLSPETEKLMNAQRFDLMKPSAFLLNTARGGLVDEPALLDALQSGSIAGAGLDSLSVEPPPADHILLQANLPNLLITPHSAWIAKEARQRLVNIAADRLQQFLRQ